jgi:phosphonate transport system substrate-binding protein
MKKTIIILVVSVFTFGFTSSVPVSAEDYKLSMLPRYFPKRIRSMIDPLAEYLAQKTGLAIKPVLTKDFTEYENRIKSGDIAIGYENPLVYAKVSKAHEVLAMAIKGVGGDKFRGIVIARPDSGIESIRDLRHKKIMIVGKTSAGGFLSQKITLSENGINAERDCAIEEASDNKQENVIISVSIGDVDAGFIRESALHVADKYIQPGSIMVVSNCAWLPNWAFSVDRDLPDEVKSKIKNAVLQLKKEGPVLKAMQLDGFRPAMDSQYDILRKLIGS